jgi:hypothetical protein
MRSCTDSCTEAPRRHGQNIVGGYGLIAAKRTVSRLGGRLFPRDGSSSCRRREDSQAPSEGKKRSVSDAISAIGQRKARRKAERA